MPLTRRSEGKKLHLLKAAAQRVGFLSAEFRRLQLPSKPGATPSPSVGAFIATIKEAVAGVGTDLILDLKPVGGIFPVGTVIVLTLASDIVGLEKVNIVLTLQTIATGGDAVQQLTAIANLSVNVDQGAGVTTTGFTSTDIGAGLLQVTITDPVTNSFDVTQCSITISGGGTTVTYQGTT